MHCDASNGKRADCMITAEPARADRCDDQQNSGLCGPYERCAGNVAKIGLDTRRGDRAAVVSRCVSLVKAHIKAISRNIHRR